MTTRRPEPILRPELASRRPLCSSAILLLALSSLLLGCAPAINEWNVVIILVDTLRADHLSAYGYDRPTSPNLDVFAEQSLLFEQAHAQSPCTFPSVNSILTSRYPAYFRGQEEHPMGIPEHIPSLAEILKSQGYTTMAVSASPIMRATPSFHNTTGGFGRGFDLFLENCLWGPGKCVTFEGMNFAKVMKQPFFMYLHYMDPHDPYNPAPQFRRKFGGRYLGDKQFIRKGNPNPIAKMIYSNGPEVDVQDDDIQRLIDLYDGEIAYFDKYFDVLIDSFREQGLLENSIIVVVADHGEAFLEHGNMKHCHTLFETDIRTPLIIHLPTEIPPRRIPHLVQNLDVVPTILDYLGHDLEPFGFDGLSLRPIIEKDLPVNEASFASWATLRSVVDPSFKVIQDLAEQSYVMYDLQADPDELDDLLGGDVAEQQKSDFRRLQQRLDAWLESTDGQVRSGEALRQSLEIQERLKALGYLQ